MVQRVITFLKTIFPFGKFKQNEVRGMSKSSPYFPSISEHTIPQLQLLRLAQKYEGKLLLRTEINLEESLFATMKHLQLFTPLNSFQQSFIYKRCLRCNNSKPSLLANIPCARCNKKHLYCRNCIMMGRVMECEPLYMWTGPRYVWPKHDRPCTWEGELTFAQNEAAIQVEKAIKNKSEILVWAVTGAGKTEILFKGISLALSKGERVCIASPRADVVRELLPRIQAAFANVQVQGLYGTSRDREATAQLIIATTHQLFRFYHAFDVIIIDEIDAFPYHADESLQFATNRAAKNVVAKIYLTATPREHLKRKISTNKLNYCFVPLRYHGKPLPTPTLIYEYSLQKQLNKNEVPKTFVAWLKRRKNKNRQLLIFVPTIKLAKSINSAVTNVLFKNQLITQDDEVISVHAEDTLREEKIELFREKKIYALITTTILERGVTFPSIDVVVLHAGHTVFDEAALVQIAGRAGRNIKDPTGEVIFIHNGKTNAIVQAVSSIKRMNIRGKKLTHVIGSDKNE